MGMEFSRSQWELIILFCLVYISWGLTDSIQAPFYPIEAANKGATPQEYGAVFGIIHLAMFVCGPLFGKYMPVLGVYRVFIFGVLATAVCSSLFGLLTYIEHTWAFLGCSYGLRLLEGVAEAGAWSSVLTILSSEFKNHVTYVYSLTQASFGFAEILGPSVGGFLFEYGGFLLPFEFSGGLCFLVGIIIIARLPYLINKKDDSLETGEGENKIKDVDTSFTTNNYSKILRSKMVLFALLGTVFSASVQGFIESFLEEYLQIFDLSVTHIGLSFLFMSVPYMFATPMWGWIVDKGMQPELVNPIGHLTIAASLVLIGPVNYIGMEPNYIITMAGLGVVGLGTAATITSTFALAQKHAIITLGESAAQNQSSLISGLWTSAFAFGNFLGPTVGGPLVTYMGFTGTTPILQIWSIIMLIIDCLVLGFSDSKTLFVKKKDKTGKPELYEQIY